MKQRKPSLASTALVVVLLGAIAPGCFPASDDASKQGSLCAKSAQGSSHCGRSSGGPEGPWKAALADGGLPIEMWAERPDSLTLAQLVENADNLRAWFADIAIALAYVRDTQRSAESYKASMEGRLRTLLDEAQSLQRSLLALQPVDAIGDFKAALAEKAGVEKSALVATLASDKQSITAAQLAFDQIKSDASPLSSSFAAVSAQFIAYRATEAAETQSYVALAKQASQSTLATLPDVEQAILVAAQSASAAPNALSLGAMKLSAQIQAFEVEAQTALEPHADFMATHGAVRPDLSSRALRSLNAMLGYIQQRVARSDATAASLLHGTAIREQALLLLDESSAPKWDGPPSPKYFTQASRDAIAKARLAAAGATFEATAKARVHAITDALPRSKMLDLPYLARRYDELTMLLSMEPLCDPTSSSWRETGCVLLRARFEAAEKGRTMELPALIAKGIASLRKAEAEAALLDAAQARLDAGDIKGAALVHDAALRGTEAP